MIQIAISANSILRDEVLQLRQSKLLEGCLSLRNVMQEKIYLGSLRDLTPQAKEVGKVMQQISAGFLREIVARETPPPPPPPRICRRRRRRLPVYKIFSFLYFSAKAPAFIFYINSEKKGR